MPEYYENPLTGRPETPRPWADQAEWEAARPYHLADTLSRAIEEADALDDVHDRLLAKGESLGVTFTSKLEANAEEYDAANAYVAALRAEAEKVCGDDLADLLASSPARRAELANYPQRAYQRYLESRQGIARPGSADVGAN